MWRHDTRGARKHAVAAPARWSENLVDRLERIHRIGDAEKPGDVAQAADVGRHERCQGQTLSVHSGGGDRGELIDRVKRANPSGLGRAGAFRSRANPRRPDRKRVGEGKSGEVSVKYGG